MKAIEERHEAWDTFQIAAIFIVDIMENVAEYEDLNNDNPPRIPHADTNQPIARPWNTPNYCFRCVILGHTFHNCPNTQIIGCKVEGCKKDYNPAAHKNLKSILLKEKEKEVRR